MSVIASACLCVAVSVGSARKDMFDQYFTQLLQSTVAKSHLPPIQRGQHHVFSAEHTTRDILSFMAQVQGLNLPSESVWTCLALPESLRDIMYFILGCNVNKSGDIVLQRLQCSCLLPPS